MQYFGWKGVEGIVHGLGTFAELVHEHGVKSILEMGALAHEHNVRIVHSGESLRLSGAKESRRERKRRQALEG